MCPPIHWCSLVLVQGTECVEFPSSIKNDPLILKGQQRTKQMHQRREERIIVQSHAPTKSPSTMLSFVNSSHSSLNARTIPYIYPARRSTSPPLHFSFTTSPIHLISQHYNIKPPHEIQPGKSNCQSQPQSPSDHTPPPHRKTKRCVPTSSPSTTAQCAAPPSPQPTLPPPAPAPVPQPASSTRRPPPPHARHASPSARSPSPLVPAPPRSTETR